MKRNLLRHGESVLSIVLILIAVVGLAACSEQNANIRASGNPASSNQNNLAFVQQNNYLTGRLYGLMTFESYGTTITFPTELTITSVPIEWMGQVFNGELEESSPGEDVTDQLHGSVSPDGAWLLTLSYSRQIIRSNNSSVLYRVELKNVPIVKMVNGVATELGNFQREGDVQKFVREIKYTDGPVENGQIVPVTTYISTDWKNINRGQKPSLSLVFESVSRRGGDKTSGTMSK